MPIVETYFVDSKTLAITFEVGDKTSPGSIIPYVAGPTDVAYPQFGNIVMREGKQYGYLVGEKLDQIHTFDTFQEDAAVAFFTHTDGVGAVDLEQNYTVTIGGVSYTPSELYHKTTILESAKVNGDFPQFVEKHTVHITLNAPLTAGETVSVSFKSPQLAAVTTKYEPETIRSEAVHVTQTGFDAQDPLKVAFLSTYLGDNAGVTGEAQSIVYKPGTAFHVVNSDTGKIVYTGAVELSQALSNTSNFTVNFSSADVYKMDFSSVTENGKYHVTVDGVGKSYDFTIGENVWQDVFETSARGMFHQRSGIAFDSENTDFVRPRDMHPDDGLVVHQSTATLMDTTMGLNLKGVDTFAALVSGDTGAVVENAWGSWHDAADYDRRIQHTESINDLLQLAEFKPDLVKSTNLNIPESGNNIPDVIDEALWGVDFYLRLQHADGGVSGGIEYDSHPKNGETSWTSTNKAYAYAPDAWSSYKYAGSAAKAAFAVAPYDQARAKVYTESAIKALKWADSHTPDYAINNLDVVQARNLAAAELYRITGDEQWNKIYLETTAYGHKTDLAWNEHTVEAAYTYAKTEQPGVDKTVQALGVTDILAQAAEYLKYQNDDGFMGTINPFSPVTWTGEITTPAAAADLFTRAHALTGDVKWQKAMIGSVQFMLGANPMNMPFITGVGENQIREIMDIDADGLGSAPRPGIPIYGLYNSAENAAGWWWWSHAAQSDASLGKIPVNESYIGWEAVPAIDEYTIQQNVSPMALLLGYIAGTDSDGSTGDSTTGGATGGTTGGGTTGSTGGTGTTPPNTGGTTGGTGTTPPNTPPNTGGNSTGGTGTTDSGSGGTPNGGTTGSAGEPPKTDTPTAPTPPVVTTPPPVVTPGDDTDDKPPVNNPDIKNHIRGGVDHDLLKGTSKGDQIDAGGSDDYVMSVGGNDTVSGGAGNDRVYGGSGHDNLFGNGGDDILVGDKGNDTLTGGTGNDFLVGLSGRDTLVGDEGDDELTGGKSSDTLTGGAGDDIFQFTKNGEGRDTITDFESGDKIVLWAKGFIKLDAGELSDSDLLIRNDKFAQSPDDHLIYDEDDHMLWYDSNGSAAGGLKAIATFSNNYSLHISDIMII